LKKKVLIIENDQEIRNIVSFILEDAGFSTMSMPEPETLNKVVQFRPHLILIDEFINSKPGHRFCLQIRQIKKLDHVPVIILSTANDIQLIATECKANDYISKPFEVEDLVSKVTQAIGTPLYPLR
jgi:two-component system phosphate regulon response regulator PhoB